MRTTTYSCDRCSEWIPELREGSTLLAIAGAGQKAPVAANGKLFDLCSECIPLLGKFIRGEE